MVVYKKIFGRTMIYPATMVNVVTNKAESAEEEKVRQKRFFQSIEKERIEGVLFVVAFAVLSVFTVRFYKNKEKYGKWYVVAGFVALVLFCITFFRRQSFGGGTMPSKMDFIFTTTEDQEN